MILTEQQMNEFNDKGFIVLKGFFEKAVMNKVSAWLDELHDKHPGENEEAKCYEKSTITNENILVGVEHVLGDHNPELTTLLLSPKADRGNFTHRTAPPFCVVINSNHSMALRCRRWEPSTASEADVLHSHV